MRLSKKPVLSARAIQSEVVRLACRIDADYEEKELLLLAVLKGSVFFAADLMRRITRPLQVDFIRAKSYDGTESTGKVLFSVLPETPLKDRHVIVVEDILDTGRTSSAILKWVRSQHPASVALCALLDKPDRRVKKLTADYCGFTIANHFVVGYGLDYNERYRNLPEIRALE